MLSVAVRVDSNTLRFVTHCLRSGLSFMVSDYLIAKMHSVVTGQAPLSLERKITSGGKQIKTDDANAITETNRILHRILILRHILILC